MSHEDTIAAVATPPGEGAIGMIRISGPASAEILAKIFEPFRGNHPLPPRRAVYGKIQDESGLLDQVMATIYRAPGSFTGEDMVEITCHGGILLGAQILALILKHGARSADPGEFSQRAFHNGKIDLTRAEAIMDIIRARTPLALRAAAQQLEGRLGNEIHALRDQIFEIVVHIEAWIDFPEEGIDPATGQLLLEKIQSAIDRTGNLLSTADDGRILREGVRVVIAGLPNAGKSSLLNRLLGLERAIVSEQPGTTRDTIEETACLRGILFRLTDTAGLRETIDPVEREGVARTGRALEGADLVLHVIDATTSLQTERIHEREILVFNKTDLLPTQPSLPENTCGISSKTGAGIENLVDCMIQKTGLHHLTSSQSLAAINARHQALLEESLKSLQAAAVLVASNQPPEISAMELRLALDSMGRIVGATDTEEILGGIFSRFCIGK
jgi:tRNA modification GTPase